MLNGIIPAKRVPLQLQVVLFALLLCASGAEAQGTFYIRDGGVSATCTDWTDACDQLPSTLQRAATYYLADGTYPGYTFDDAVSGTSVITVKKATEADHGTNTGWSSTHGDGQANFTGGLIFVTDHWTIDGSTRNEANWADGPSYGIKTTSIFTNSLSFGHASDNVTLKYLDIGPDYGSSDNPSYGDLIYLGGFGETADNWLIHRSYIHNGRVLGQHAGVHNVTYELSFLGPNWTKTGIRHQVRGSSVTIRYNIFRNACQGQPGVPGVGESCTAIVGWYGNAGSNGENYSNSAVYGNVFIDTIGTVFYSGGALVMGDDRTSQGGGPQDCTGCKIFNNTFVGIGSLNPSSHVGFEFTGIKTNTEARNNIWHNVGSHTPFCQAAVCSDNPTVANASQFINPAASNFRLVSPTANGAPLSSPYNTDADGKLRGTDGIWDLGAYEYLANGGGDTIAPAAPSNLTISPP